MSESAGIDSILREQSMPRPYSNDLRARVIEALEAGASRREAADRYELSPSVVVIWAQRWEETGSVAARPSGGALTGPSASHRRQALAWCRSIVQAACALYERHYQLSQGRCLAAASAPASCNGF